MDIKLIISFVLLLTSATCFGIYKKKENLSDKAQDILCSLAAIFGIAAVILFRFVNF